MAEELKQAIPAQKRPRRRKKLTVGKIIWIIIGLAAVAGAVFGMMKLFQEKDDSQVMTDTAFRGSLSTQVWGSGVTVAKNSASITLLSGGTVSEIFVSEGQWVTAGTLLYKIDSKDAEASLKAAQTAYDELSDQLEKTRADSAKLLVCAPHGGTLHNVISVAAGQQVTKGDRICSIVDDTRLRVALYYSYAYEKEIKVGQTASVSIPAVMIKLDGKVEEIQKVRRVSDEGSLLFKAIIAINNPGVLTEGMIATAYMTGADGEIIAPYEDSKLEYYGVTEVSAQVSGPAEWYGLMDFAAVKQGQELIRLGARDIDAEILSLEGKLKTAAETLEKAKSEMGKLNAEAPIDGTVLSLGIMQGQEAPAGTVAVSIADTSTMIINAKIDEMNIAYVKAGMPVSVEQWNATAFGTVESVSLNGQYENGVSYFPAVITVENPEGTLMSGSYVSFSLSGSKSDDCIILPIQSVKYVETEGGAKTVVFVQKDARPDEAVELNVPMEEVPAGYWPVPVEVGISDDYNVEIVSGVAEGDVVFTQIMKQNSWNN